MQLQYHSKYAIITVDYKVKYIDEYNINIGGNMLELRKISKIYETESFKQKALDSVSINFRKNEFVSILGPSGSGKTTLLNIIGGLDDYTSGDLIINGVSTKQYKDSDWDIYRNHKVGFVFQSYNLIPHQSVIANVELALTLSGVSKAERRRRAKEALKNVGLENHIYKRPNQLSGGQMQRVAIARALVNDPDILLADEPTGALDSKTSTQIMDLLAKVAKDRLVIMVTHNQELAEAYSTRIIELKDGVKEGDTNPYDEVDEKIKARKSKKKNMSFTTALSLSLNNLLTKKGRTILTAFAGSIGIIGIALILSLSSGVQNYIDRIQEETLTSYPLTIESESVDLTQMALTEAASEKEKENRTHDKVYANNTIGDMLSLMSSSVQNNNLEQFKKFINDDSQIKEFTSTIEYKYPLDLQLFHVDDNGAIVQVNPNTVLESLGFDNSNTNGITFEMANVWNKLYTNDELNNKMFELVTGKMPENFDEVVILIDKDYQISDFVLYALGLKDQQELKDMMNKIMNGEEVTSTATSYEFADLLNLKFKVLLNSDYYTKVGNYFVDKKDDVNYLRNKLNEACEIKVVGIIKPNEDATVSLATAGGIYYLDALEKYVIAKNNESEIIQAQKANPNINILTGLPFSNEEFQTSNLSPEQLKYLQSLSPDELASVIESYRVRANMNYDSVLRTLGDVDLEKPSAIYLYAKDFEAKDEIKSVIDEYNKNWENQNKEENVIHYSDLVGMLMSSVTDIVDIISYVLIGFVSISLVVYH